MSLSRLMTQPLTVQAMGAVGYDIYGSEIPGAVGAPVAVNGYLEQSTTVEVVLNRDTTVTTWKAYLPASVVITPLSIINFQAQVFQVDGEPWDVWNPRTKAVDHIECKLIVVKG
jgi:hypothetical protein